MADAFGEDWQHVGIFWLFKLDEPANAGAFSVTPAIPVTFRRISPENIPSLAQVMRMEDPSPIIRRFDQGKHCYAAFHGDEIVTYGWVTFDEEGIGELGLTARMRKGECYIWDCGTPPAYRGKRLYPALLAHILTELPAEGISRAWLGTDADNIPSQKGVALVGFQPIIDVGYAPSPIGNTMWIRQRPDVSDQDAMDARRVLLGHL